MKICEKNKILNTNTNRCVKIDGAIGKKILKKSVRKSASRKKCKKNQILNPSNGLCVKKKDILQISSKNKKILKNKYDIEVPKDYYVSKILGIGAFGSVYILCKISNNDCSKAIKIQDYNENFKKEVKMHQKFEKLGIAPKIYEAKIHYFKNKIKTHIVLEKFDGTFKDLLNVKQSDIRLNNILDFIKKSTMISKNNKLVHGDMHWDNLAYRKDDLGNIKYFYLNDFGWSSKVKNVTKDLMLLDLIQLYRTLWLIKNNYNRIYLEEGVRQLIIDRIGIDIRNYDEKEIDDLFFNYLHENYKNKYF